MFQQEVAASWGTCECHKYFRNFVLISRSSQESEELPKKVEEKVGEDSDENKENERGEKGEEAPKENAKTTEEVKETAPEATQPAENGESAEVKGSGENGRDSSGGGSTERTAGDAEEDAETVVDLAISTPKEKECWHLFRHMNDNGVNVSFETVLR